MKIDKKGSKKNISADTTKIKKRKGLKIFLGTLLGAVVIYSSIFVTYLHQPNMSEKSLYDTVQSYGHESVVDDVMALNSYAESAAKMYNLENYLDLLDTLKNMQLSRYNEGLTVVDTTEVGFAEVTSLIDEFRTLESTVDKNTPTPETRRFYEVVGILSSYENNMSSHFIRNNISSINHYVDGVIKGITIDSLGADFATIDDLKTNLANTEEEFTVSYIDPVSGKTFEISVGWLTNINALVNDTRKLNRMINPTPNSNGEVKEYTDEELEAQVSKIINELKVAQAYKYNIENGKFNQQGNNITKGFIF